MIYIFPAPTRTLNTANLAQNAAKPSPFPSPIQSTIPAGPKPRKSSAAPAKACFRGPRSLSSRLSAATLRAPSSTIPPSGTTCITTCGCVLPHCPARRIGETCWPPRRVENGRAGCSPPERWSAQSLGSGSSLYREEMSPVLRFRQTSTWSGGRLHSLRRRSRRATPNCRGNGSSTLRRASRSTWTGRRP